MTYEFIRPRDCDCTPARYAQYLRDQSANAARLLALPVQQWPRGSSHEISRAIMAECQEAHSDLALEYGRFTADGKLADYAEA